MASYLDIADDNGLKAKIDERAPHLFQTRTGKPQLQVSKYRKKKGGDDGKILNVEPYQDVRNILEIRALRNESKDSSQFFLIRQQHSWATLDISRELFEDLLKTYGVFRHFWNVAFTFGIKTEENEFAFPHFRARRSISSETNIKRIFESACVLRRVELNHREIEDGQSPWSIRQTGIYQKLCPTGNSECLSMGSPSNNLREPKSAFIIIAPSKTFEAQLSQCLELSKLDDRAIGPSNIYRMLVGESMSGWMDYMTFLEKGLKEQSEGIIYAKVGEEKENLSPLKDFKINFIDRQTLKLLEDSVIDLQVILPTLLGTIVGIRDQCKRCCKDYHEDNKNECDCDLIIDDLNEHIREVEGHVKRAEALKERANSTAQLLSDLLSYEDAVALKEVAKESQNESKTMLFLTVQSTKDAAAVKILTIISLIYLPSTIVANFFSTQFFKTDDNGNLVVAESAWILAVFVFPLTAFTIAAWYAWDRWSNPTSQKHHQRAHIQKRVRSYSWGSFLSSKKGRRSPDLESRTFSGADTWPSMATTVVTNKSG